MIWLPLILAYTFFYPIVMTIFWILGGLFYYIKNNKNQKNNEYKKVEKQEEFSLIMPVYNEERNIEELLTKMLNLDYPKYKVVVIDDLSTDNTRNILKQIESKKEYKDKLHIIYNEENLGKAGTLNAVFPKLKTEYAIVVDSDTELFQETLDKINYYIQNETDDKVIAYTGNPTIKDRDQETIVSIQRIEYRSIIDMIKRTQQFFTKNIMTLSGAISIFKVDKILEIGGFTTKNATEDIEITWRLSRLGYRAKYLPDVQVEIFTPKTKNSLLRQRGRWSLGLLQTLKQNIGILFTFKNWTHKLFFVEFLASSIWIITFYITTVYLFLRLVFGFPEPLAIQAVILPTLILLITSLIFMLVAYLLESNKKESFFSFLKYFWYYPVIFWFVQPIGYTIGAINYLTVKKETSGKWRHQNNKNLKIRRFFAQILDAFIVSVLIYLLKAATLEIFNYTNKTNFETITLMIFYAIVYLYILYAYFLKNKVQTFGYSVLAIEEEVCGKIYNIYNIVFLAYAYEIIRLLIKIILYITTSSTIVLKQINDIVYNIDSSFTIVAIIALILLIIDAFLNITLKLRKTKIRIEKD